MANTTCSTSEFLKVKTERLFQYSMTKFKMLSGPTTETILLLFQGSSQQLQLCTTLTANHILNLEKDLETQSEFVHLIIL
jgi:hypothetical protein